MKRHLSLLPALALTVAAIAASPFAACSHAPPAASEPDAADAGPVDDVVVPVGCSTTAQCQLAYLLDADTCVFDLDLPCAPEGHCVQLSSGQAQCSSMLTVCTCGGETEMVPGCWDGQSPIPVRSMGPCTDGGG
jgi:hypothetical protein